MTNERLVAVEYVWVTFLKNSNIIESVWTSEELAKAAIRYHADQANLPERDYDYIPRVLNAVHKPK